MDDEIKDELKKSKNSEFSDNSENSEYTDSSENSHSDYKPVNRFDASVVHHLSGMYQNWFLDYASYVILERAVPHIEDGLKPVQRRIHWRCISTAGTEGLVSRYPRKLG